MFGFVRPAACRSSAPRSVTDGRPYPPLPRRAKKQKQDSTVFSQKTGNQRKWWERLPPLRTPSTVCGRSPSLEEGGLGAARALSKILIQLRVQGRNPARFNGGYGVPRGFKGEKSKFPPNPLGLAERVYSFHRPRGGPPPSKREVLGFRRSRPPALPSITYRGFAVAPITLRAPSRRVVVITSGTNGRAMRAPTGYGDAAVGCKCI